MKAMQPEKLRAMTDDELGQEAVALREEIWKLRLQRATGQLQDTHKVRRTRRDLARILTVLREREKQPAAGGTSERRRR
jgi:large subunit ribosomal protein L29